MSECFYFQVINSNAGEVDELAIGPTGGGMAGNGPQGRGGLPQHGADANEDGRGEVKWVFLYTLYVMLVSLFHVFASMCIMDRRNLSVFQKIHSLCPFFSRNYFLLYHFNV